LLRGSAGQYETVTLLVEGIELREGSVRYIRGRRAVRTLRRSSLDGVKGSELRLETAFSNWAEATGQSEHQLGLSRGKEKVLLEAKLGGQTPTKAA
jgi:hypothetical protein